MFYRLMHENAVPVDKRNNASETMLKCCWDLKIDPVEIIWIRKTKSGIFSIHNFLGMHSKGKIYLNVDQDTNRLKKTLMHEVRHVWQAIQIKNLDIDVMYGNNLAEKSDMYFKLNDRWISSEKDAKNYEGKILQFER